MTLTKVDLARRIMVAGIVGNILEWYDFTLYGYLAPITSELFYPSHDPLASLINAYFVSALGFLARPLGGDFLGRLGDRLSPAPARGIDHRDGGADLHHQAVADLRGDRCADTDPADAASPGARLFDGRRVYWIDRLFGRAGAPATARPVWQPRQLRIDDRLGAVD